MSITAASPRETILEWAAQALEIIEARGDADAATGIRQAIDAYRQNRFLLVVLGKTKRGKSTLINAQLGRRDDELAPVSKLPASAVITRLSHANQEAATVHFQDGRQASISYSDVQMYVTEEHNPRNCKAVSAVEIQGPFPNLDDDVVLLDTPGAGSIHAHHDVLLQAAIPQADAVIFLVTARSPLDQDELELLRALKEADVRKIFFAINMVDAADESEIQEGIAHNRRLLEQLGIPVHNFHRLSAKTAFTGSIASSGLPELNADIRAFLCENKGRVLNERFISRVEGILAGARQRVILELASAQKSIAQLDSDLNQFQSAKAQVEQEREFTGREFAIEWGRAVDTFALAVKDSRQAAKAAILAHISGAGLRGMSAMRKELPARITQVIEDSLRESATRLESRLSQACTRLRATYPNIDVDAVGAITLRTRAGNTLIVGGATGAALGAGGISLAAAGSTAAASIASTNAAAITAMSSFHAAGIVGSVLSWAASLVSGPVSGLLTAVGASSSASAAPVALLATPMWVALSGPVGWTLSGIGVLSVPFAWRLGKLKEQDHLTQAATDEVERVFTHIIDERVPALRRLGTSILDEFHVRLDRHLSQLESSLVQSRHSRPAPEALARLRQLDEGIQQALAGPRKACT